MIVKFLKPVAAVLAGVLLAYLLPQVLLAFAPMWLGILYQVVLAVWIASVLYRAGCFEREPKPARGTLMLADPDDARCFSNGMHVVVSSEDGSRGR